MSAMVKPQYQIPFTESLVFPVLFQFKLFL